MPGRLLEYYQGLFLTIIQPIYPFRYPKVSHTSLLNCPKTWNNCQADLKSLDSFIRALLAQALYPVKFLHFYDV